MRGEDGDLPDLLETLQPSDPDWTWVHEVHEIMQERSRIRTSLRLLQCEREPEGAWTGIAVLDELQRGNVRSRDAVHGGFLALRDEVGLAVYPRVYRQICSNGAIAAGLIHVDVRDGEVGVGDAVRACLSGEEFTGTVARFQAAAELVIGDEVRFLLRARLERAPRDVLAAREDQDRTVWGLVNALTALARGAGDLRERVKVERQVENILQAAGIGRWPHPRRQRRERTPRAGVGATR
jgi:hypothetical protein